MPFVRFFGESTACCFVYDFILPLVHILKKIKYLPVEVMVARLVGKLNEAISPEVPVKY